MSSFTSVLDYVIAVLSILGIGLQLTRLYLELSYQIKLEGTFFRSIRKISNTPTASFNEMWLAITITVLVLYALERYGLDISFIIILITTILYMAVGTILAIAEMVIRLLDI